MKAKKKFIKFKGKPPKPTPDSPIYSRMARGSPKRALTIAVIQTIEWFIFVYIILLLFLPKSLDHAF